MFGRVADGVVAEDQRPPWAPAGLQTDPPPSFSASAGMPTPSASRSPHWTSYVKANVDALFPSRTAGRLWPPTSQLQLHGGRRLDRSGEFHPDANLFSSSVCLAVLPGSSVDSQSADDHGGWRAAIHGMPFRVGNGPRSEVKFRVGTGAASDRAAIQC